MSEEEEEKICLRRCQFASMPMTIQKQSIQWAYLTDKINVVQFDQLVSEYIAQAEVEDGTDSSA